MERLRKGPFPGEANQSWSSSQNGVPDTPVKTQIETTIRIVPSIMFASKMSSSAAGHGLQ
jgi:hypothetical protein